MIQRIFIDLDDVCNTLAVWILYRRGCITSPTDYSLFPVECGYDVVTAANQLGGLQYTIPSFWGSIPREWWATVPESEIFPWILERCSLLIGRENICIATSPTKDPDCLAGKLEWIHKHCPHWIQRQYAITPRKYLFARDDALLIDDNPHNINVFCRNGGIGLLVPRPWNNFRDLDPRTYVENGLNLLFGV
jgi:hypothetical protein